MRRSRRSGTAGGPCRANRRSKAAPGRDRTANSPLQAELYVSAEAIGLIRSGQDVRVRYDAFPYLRYGSYHGRVVQVSHTALTQADNISTPIPIKDAAVTG